MSGSCVGAGSPAASLWDASVAAAQARGESVSLYAPPAQTPQAPKLYTGWGLEQEPAQARSMASSFLQIDRCAACFRIPLMHYRCTRALCSLRDWKSLRCGPLRREDSGAPRALLLENAMTGSVDFALKLLKVHLNIASSAVIRARVASVSRTKLHAHLSVRVGH